MSSSQPSPHRTVSFLRAIRALWFVPLFAFMAIQCRLASEEKGDTVISFTNRYDSLKLYDSVVITLKSLDGNVLDVVFAGKVENVSDIQKLRAPHWDGGRVIVAITGTKNGAVTYQVETRFDPATGTHDNVVVIAAPEEGISSLLKALTLYVGETIPLPRIDLLPANLKDRSLEWASDPAALLSFSSSSLSGAQPGKGALTVHLKINHSVSLTIPVEILPVAMMPETVWVQPESLKVAAGGAEKPLIAQVLPSGAPTGVNWSSEDSGIARVDASGHVKGIRKGETRIWAASRLKPGLNGSAAVKVSDPTPVVTVAFARDSMEIMVGAAAESLSVTVLPGEADPTVTFALSDSTKASIRNGMITGKEAGSITVTAFSASNPALVDHLVVRIVSPVQIDSIAPGKPTVTVKPSGPTRERRPSWTWKTGGNGGAGAYQASLDKATFDTSAISLSDTAYKPAADLPAGPHVLYVRERDASGNWSDAGSAQIEIDLTPPPAPTVLGASQTNTLPRWTWTSGGNGGAGIFRFRLGDANFPANAPESGDTVYALSTATSGTSYTLYVQERDLAGNWSSAGSLAIKYDLTKPTVAILLPQASGTFITPFDTVTIVGTATGPHGIAKAEYVLDAGTALPITVPANGTWALPALKFANGKVTTLKFTATDDLGNTGEALLQVLRDSDPPLPPATLVKPTSPTGIAQSAWTWSAGGDGAAGSGLSGKYRWKLNSGIWTETSTASATSVMLSEGSNTFSVQEQDKAGNWSDALTGTVVLDTKAPDAVAFLGVEGSYTSDDTPTWSWKPSPTNGGIGEYLAKLDAGTEFDLDTATTYTPVTPLSDNATHVLTVREKDQVPGVAGTAKSFSYKVKVNPPGAPAVRSAVSSLANNGLTNNPGFAWSTGGGGNGKFRVKVNSEAACRVNGAAQTTFSLATSDADGTYTIRVSEQDDLGRWGAEGSYAIRLDRTGPVYTQVRLKGTAINVPDGFITNADIITITYQADNVSKELSCTLALDKAANTCKASSQVDSAGNSTTFQRTVWRRSNVVFFRPDGTGDGSSWDAASGDLKGLVEGSSLEGKELWLGSGDYSGADIGVNFKSSIKLFGGFNASAYPTDASNRNKTNTTVGVLTYFSSAGDTLDGIKFKDLQLLATTMTAIDCQFQTPDGIEVASASDFLAKNCTVSGVRSSGPILSISGGGSVTLEGGNFINNMPGLGNTIGNYAIEIGDSTSRLTIQNSVIVSGNKNPSQTQPYSIYQILNSGKILIDASITSFNCSDINNQNGTGSCRGNAL